MPWIYDQSSGEITHDGSYVGTGYSGNGTSRNRPTDQHLRNRGPIPRGRYTIGPPHQSARTGPHVLNLRPNGHNALGRTDFQIHGNNATNDASNGCIILGPAIRRQISSSGDTTLIVVQ